MQPLHILLTADMVGGVWDYCCVLAAELTSAGHAVTLLAFGEPSAAQQHEATTAGANLVAVPLKLEWMQDSAADVHCACAAVAALVEEVKPDILHANQFMLGSSDLAIPVLLAAHSDVLSWLKWTAPPASGAEHVTAPPEQTAMAAPIPAPWREYAALVRAGLRGAGAVVAVSHFLRTEIAQLYGAGRPISVIYNGWPLPPGDPPPIQDRGRLTLLAGRVWDSAKNIGLAATAAHGWEPGRVVCAGHQRHPETGMAMEVGHPIEALGHLSREELDRYLGTARVYLAPARYEPFGLLPLQAALAGCPLLLSDIPAFRELWDGAALFFRPDDAADLRRRWSQLLEDDDLAAHLAGRARHRARDRYSASRMASGYMHLYAQLLATQGGRSAMREYARPRQVHV